MPGVICNIVVKADLGRSTPQMHHGIYIMECIWQAFWILQEKVGISFHFWIMRLLNTQLALYSHVRCNPFWQPLDTPHMTITNFNYEGWYELEISFYFWIIRLVNTQLALYTHVRCNPLNTPLTPKNTPTWQLQITPMTITNFNSEGSYLPCVICNIDVKADLGRSTPKIHHGIYIMECIW